MTKHQTEAADQFLGTKAVLRIGGFSRSTLYNYIKAGSFPKPYRIGPNRTAFALSEVNAWIEATKAARA